MCGLFGFIGRESARPVESVLRSTARSSATRGRHAWGLAFADGDFHKEGGNIEWSMNMNKAWNLSRDQSMVLGHTRYATQGDPDDNTNNHPHTSDRMTFVHNGMVENYHSLQRMIDPSDLGSECDSEIIGWLADAQEGTLADRVETAMYCVSRKRPNAVLAVDPEENTMVAYRRGHPLHIRVRTEGVYFSSLPCRQGTWSMIPSEKPLAFDLTTGRLITGRGE